MNVKRAPIKATKPTTLPELEAITQPVRFSASVFFLQPTAVAEWVVARYAPDDVGAPTFNEFTFTGREREALESLKDAIRLRGSAAKATEILNRGTFRQSHWVKVKTALSSGIPDEVKEVIKGVDRSHTGTVYLARAEQLRLDLELLGCLAQLAGALHGERWTEVRQQINRGMKLFDTVWRLDILPPDPGRSLGIDDELDELTPLVARQEVSKRAKRIGTSALKIDANVLFSRAFDRGLGKLDANYWYRGTHGPGLRLTTTSIQSSLYLTLLANLTREWRKCKREDCDVVFQLGRRQEKVYCTQKCAHLDDVRNRRARQRQEEYER
jgi:hypothetical protein